MKKRTARLPLFAALASCVLGGTAWAATATVDVAVRHQSIRGFGTCSAWNGTLTAEEGVQLWDTIKGAGLSTHRIMIERDGSPDVNEKNNAKLATGYGVKVWGTPWYSKYAVKVPNQDYDTLYEDKMQAWANDLATMAKAMKAAGTPLYAISPQNESDLGWVKYDPKAMALWVGKYLGPTMAAQAPEVKVMASEACNWYGFSGYEPVLIADPNVMKYSSIFATHLYGGQAKAYPEIQAAGKEFWQTEIYDPLTDVEDTGIVSGLRVSKLIHEGLTVANFNAWHFWWIKPCTNCANGALWAEATKRPTKRLWIMGNWSRFVRPGFVRVEAPVEPTAGLLVTAFRDSNLSRTVIVAVNTNTSSVSQDFAFKGGSVRTLTPYVTDATRNIAGLNSQTVNASSFTYSLPAQSVTSLVLDMGPAPAGATLYQYANYGGLNTKIPMGSYTLAQLNAAGIPDNAVASMALDTGLSAELFDEDNFHVPLGVFATSQSDLTTLPGKLTSLRISKASPPTAIVAHAALQGSLRYAAGQLRGTGAFAARLRILDGKGAAREIDLRGGSASVGSLAIGVYRLVLLEGNVDAGSLIVMK